MYPESSLSYRFALFTEPVDLLRERVRGAIFTDHDAGYETVRKPSLLFPNPRPYAIVQTETVADIVTAVDFAREIGFPLAVRSGGHSRLSGFGEVDDGIAIELDPAINIARVQAGITSQDVVAAVSPCGWYCPLAIQPPPDWEGSLPVDRPNRRSAPHRNWTEKPWTGNRVAGMGA